MRRKKFRTLWAKSRKECCLKKFFDLHFLAKYGSIFIVLLAILLQAYNIILGENFALSFISLLFNLSFLLVILVKLKVIKMDFLLVYLDSMLKLIIFIFLLNSILYIFVDSIVYNYFFAPINFLGAYFIFLLLKQEAFI